MAKYLDLSGLTHFWNVFKSRLLPSGGSSGQVLAKSSATDYDVTWVNQSGGGGGDVATVAEITSLLVAAGWNVSSGASPNNLDEVSY